MHLHSQDSYGAARGAVPPISRKEAKAAKRSSFTLLNILLNGLLIVALVGVNKLGALGNVVCLACLSVIAVQSVAGALKAMAILSLVIVGNPFIVEKSLVLTFFRFPVFGLAGARILYEMLRYRPDLLREAHLNALLVFGLVCVLLAPINGYFVSVSILKAVLFTFGAYVILVGTELNRSKMSDLTVFFTAVIGYVVLGTYATFPLGISHIIGLAETGYAMAHAGLAGITSHQQSLGSFLALSAVFSFSLAAFAKIPHRWLLVCLLIGSAPLLYMTLSRTAVGTALLSLLLVVGAAPFVVRRQKAMFNRFKPIPWLAGGLLAFITIFIYDMATDGSISQEALDFALKGLAGRVYTIQAEDFAATRLGLIEQSWSMFLTSPWTGINFGTSTSPYFIQNASLLSAPTEKGFIPTAVLEEVGIIGASFFLVFLFLMFRKLYLEENILGIALFGGFLIQNFGEMMFFSFGGAGLFSWSIVGAGIAVGYRHQFIRRV